MSIPAQLKKVFIQIYSVDYCLKCDVSGISKEIMRISPEINKVDMFQVNDPIVCMYIHEGNHRILGGDVIEVSKKDNTVDIAYVDYDVKEERRIFERYPASLEVSARRKFSSKRLRFIAKNISEYGMGAISQADLELEESIDIDLITGKYMFYFVGKAVWKKEIGNCFEYGFQLTDFDIATKSSMEAYLGKLKDEYRGMHLKAK